MTWLDWVLLGMCIALGAVLMRDGRPFERRAALLMVALACGFVGVMVLAKIGRAHV